MKNKQQNGFNFTFIIVSLAIIGIVGLISWRVYNQFSAHKSAMPANTRNPSSSNSSLSTNEGNSNLSFANDIVRLQAPKNWILTRNESPSTLHDATCLDGASFMPPDKPTTIYGNGTEFFKVNLYVCNLKSCQTIKDWFQNDYGAGGVGPTDQYSTESINGYDTFYFKQINNSYNEINYAIGASGKAVLLTARVWEVHYDPYNDNKIDATMDVTRYIPDIEAMAKSVHINPQSKL